MTIRKRIKTSLSDRSARIPIFLNERPLTRDWPGLCRSIAVLLMGHTLSVIQVHTKPGAVYEPDRKPTGARKKKKQEIGKNKSVGLIVLLPSFVF